MNPKNEKQNQPEILSVDPENKAGQLTDNELDEISGGFFMPAVPFDARHKLSTDIFIIINPHPFP